MINVSEIKNTAPAQFKNALQEKVYGTLAKLQIPYERVDTDEVITMEDCIAIMESMLGTKIGAATVLSCLLDTASGVRIVFDKDVLTEEYYGCSDGTTTGYMKVKMEDIMQKLLKYAGVSPDVIEV